MLIVFYIICYDSLPALRFGISIRMGENGKNDASVDEKPK